MKKINIKKLIILNIPYVIVGLVATNIGEAFRIAGGTNASEKLQSVILDGYFGKAFSNPFPSFHPVDLLVGAVCGGALWLAVYIRHKNAKHFRHNAEYGSARWGTHADIEPFMDPKLQPVLWRRPQMYVDTVRRMFGFVPENLEDFVEASEIVQAEVNDVHAAFHVF